ncbi:MAG: alkaline phosphatase family protein [Myxococcales bacterium]|nr:alkaline phosphatase family protein [Myxococcales bacterium]HQY60945.1 alkaline phosphatase family protein [Polyangiaceae bacterium]
MRVLSRRRVLLGVGGLMAAACGSSADEPGGAPSAEPSATSTPTATGPSPEAGPPPGTPDASTKPDASPPPPAPTPEELFSTIDAIVVLMMENRSFDHYLGTLSSDAGYPNRATVTGLKGTETNPAPDGTPVAAYKSTNFTPADPPHGFTAAHAQWNGGLNDGFVKAHAGPDQRDVMGYHDRSQIPFYYWLADNFTVCDHWFSSVLGPTWPNRYYLHAASSGGKTDNTPYFTGGPATVWEKLKAAGKTAKNYAASGVGWYTGAFIGRLLQTNPVRPISEFFADARAGKLPHFSIIDPDFLSNDDHPSHDIRAGQAFAASIYKALAESPQWGQVLFVITYDENGGFFDHVPPPAATDERAEFQRLGFRVPAFVIGPTVRRGHLETGVLEHVSVLSTVKTRFGIAPLNQRMAVTRDLSSCIDPAFYKAPQAPPPGMPTIVMARPAAPGLGAGVGVSSQPELEAMVTRGEIPASMLVDRRPPRERYATWLAEAEALGVVRLE